MAIAKEQVQQILTQNDIQSVSDVYDLMRESFKDILQELLEAEMDASLGYKKNQKGIRSTSNKRNGHSTKILKSQFGEFPVEIPRTGMASFSLFSYRNTRGMSLKLKARLFLSTAEV